MNMQEIRSIAKDYKFNAAGMSKIDIIRTIQREEGNFDCFASAIDGVCDQENCIWRKDCFDAARAISSKS